MVVTLCADAYKKERKNEKEIMNWDTMSVDAYNKMVWSGKVRTVLLFIGPVSYI